MFSGGNGSAVHKKNISKSFGNELKATETETNNDNNNKYWIRIDGFIVEMIASFFVCSVCVMHWAEPDHLPDDWTIQFLPPLSWGIIMLTIHDREGWFPDTSSFMTIIQWSLGSYAQWDIPIIRIVGQTAGMALCIALLSVHGISTQDLTEHHEANIESIFVLNTAATFLDHVAALYIILPLLPFFDNINRNANQDVHQRHHLHKHLYHSPTKFTATVERIALPAFVFAGVHWTLWKTFNSEMNPMVSLVIAVQRQWQLGSYDEAAWKRTAYSVGGQFTGLLFCVMYIYAFIPKISSKKEVT